MKFFIKQLIKMAFQQIFLPVVYNIYAIKPICPGTVLLADAHHDEIPFSMRALKKELDIHPELHVTEMYWNSTMCSAVSLLRHMLEFMKAYAVTETVIICDNFLPAASCRKRRGTKVIQLWHACGAFKKFGYDTDEDIPSYYRGNVMANCNMVTVSSKNCVKAFASAMRLPERRIQPVGVSRTDLYFDETFNMKCREQFFERYPEASGKKIVLWAPTFRGNPGEAGVQGLKEIKEAKERLRNTHYFIIKLHPHTQIHTAGSNCPILTEELLPVADIVITDYSSIIFDAMIYRRPLVLFVPDFSDYSDNRGFYLDYADIPGIRAVNAEELIRVLADDRILSSSVDEKYKVFYKKYMAACDGHATERVMRYIESNIE